MCFSTRVDRAVIEAVEQGDVVQLSSLSVEELEAITNVGDTLLIAAVKSNQHVVVDYLLKRGVDCDAQGNCGQTALMVAVRKDRQLIVEKLLQAGVDLCKVHTSGRTALQEAVLFSTSTRVQQLVRAALEHRNQPASTNEVYAAIVTAVMIGDCGTLTAIIDCLPEFKPDRPIASFMTVDRLCSATPLQQPPMLQKLYESNANILFVPCVLRNPDCLQHLLNLGMDVDCVDTEGWTPLMTAACAGATSCINLLCERGANVDVSSLIGRTSIWLASLTGHVDAVNALLDMGADIDRAECEGFTPLIVAAAQGMTKVVEVLVKRNAQVNAKTNLGFTAIAMAAHYGHFDCVQTLLEAGCDINMTNKRKEGPLHLAAANGHSDIVLFLLAQRASIPPQTAKLLTSVDSLPCGLSSWDALSSLVTEEQLMAITGVEGFPSLPRGTPPTDPKPRKQVLELILTSVVFMLESFLQVYHQPDNQQLGRRPAFLLTMITNSYIPCEMPPHLLKLLLHQWQRFKDAFSMTTFFHDRMGLTSGCIPSADVLVSRYGNLLTAFHDARRLLWPREGRERGTSGAAPLHQFVEEHRIFLNSLVSSSAAASDLVAWHCLLEYGDVLDTGNKHRLLQSELRLAHGGSTKAGQLHLEVTRVGMMEGLCKQFSSGMGLAENSTQGVTVKFAGEEGLGDGLRREWFTMAASEFFNLDYGLFTTNDGGRSYHPSPRSDVHDQHLYYFEMLGRIVGLAVLHGGHLPGAHFSRSFRKEMLGQPIHLTDLEHQDPQLYANLKMMENCEVDVQDLCLNFMTHDPFGRPVELIPGGSQIDVTEDNKLLYIEKLMQYKLMGGVQPQVDAFMKGWNHLVPNRVRDIMRRCLSSEELDMMIGGEEQVDVADWRAHTTYEDCEAITSQVLWWWEVVSGMSNRQRAALLGFVTGSTAVPAGGFGSLLGFNSARTPFTIVLLKGGSDDRLPTARTCFNSIHLPKYSSKAVMETRLLQILEAPHVFDEGIWR